MGETSLSDLSDNFQVIIDPLNKAILSAQLSVPVKKIHKKMGDSFNKGDVLLELDNSIYIAQLKKARAILEKAQNTYQAKEELFDARIASLSELKEAYAEWASAQAEFEVSKKQLEACKIVAPYRGKVASVLLFEHELPQVGQPLVEVVGDEVLLAKMLVDAKYLPLLSVDKPIEIYVNELKQNLTARIKRIGSVIDPASSTIAVEAEIINNDSALIAGMTGFTLFTNESSSTRFTIEEALPAPLVLEAPKKVYAAAKTIFKNEGNFTEAIKSGNIPSLKPNPQAPLKFSGNVDSELAARLDKTNPLPPLNREGHLDPLLVHYFYKKSDAAKVYLAFQSDIDSRLSPFYVYLEPKKNIAPLNYNGTLNEPLARNSLSEKEKAKFYSHEGSIKEGIAFYGEEKSKEPIPFAGTINNEVALSSLENLEKERRLYSAVEKAEVLNRFEEDLKNNLAPLSYIPDMKRPLKIAALPVSGKIDDALAQNHSEEKNEPIASIDQATRALPEKDDLNEASISSQTSATSSENNLEEVLEPLSFIPEIETQETNIASQSLDKELEPLSFIPEIKIENEKIAYPYYRLPHIAKRPALPDESIIAIEKSLKNPFEFASASLFKNDESIAAVEIAEEPPREWQETLLGGGSGGKEIE